MITCIYYHRSLEAVILYSASTFRVDNFYIYQFMEGKWNLYTSFLVKLTDLIHPLSTCEGSSVIDKIEAEKSVYVAGEFGRNIVTAISIYCRLLGGGYTITFFNKEGGNVVSIRIPATELDNKYGQMGYTHCSKLAKVYACDGYLIVRHLGTYNGKFTTIDFIKPRVLYILCKIQHTMWTIKRTCNEILFTKRDQNMDQLKYESLHLFGCHDTYLYFFTSRPKPMIRIRIN